MVAGSIERRSMGALGRMGVVAALHVAVVFLIARSLGIVPPILQPQRIEVTSVDQPDVRDDPPPDIAPHFVDPDIHFPPPEDAAPELPPQTDGVSAKAITDVLPIVDGPGTPEIPGLIVNARQDARHPLSQPRYPLPDIREENEGNADVEVYVLPNGRVGDARIARSSGFERLDQSALDEAKRNWRLVPATRDGVPFAQWYKVRVTFKLTNAR
jgi:protein TonB